MYEEREVNLKFICYQALKRWRQVIIFGIIIALLAGAYKLYSGFKVRFDDELLAEAESQYQIELDNYNATGRLLSDEIENIRTARLRQAEYNENSLLMKINPLDEYVASFDIYIDSKFQINPELTYQNIDTTRRLIGAYSNYLTRGELYSYILENTELVSETRYLAEVLKFDVNYDAASIHVFTQGPDEAACKEILELVRSGVEQQYNVIMETIGDHTYSILNESGYVNVDLELDEQQKENIQNLSELANQLSVKYNEYNDWKQTPEPEPTYSSASCVKDAVKFVLIGGVTGVVLALIYFAFMAMTTDRLLDGKDVRNHMPLRLIGELPRQRKKRPFSGIDNMFARFGGVTLKPESYDEMCAVIGRYICGLIEGENPCVTLVGTSGRDKLKQVRESIERNASGYRMCEAGDIASDAAAVAAAQEADYIVLVERQGGSTYTQLENELESLKLWNKNVLGIIVTDADTVTK